MAADRRILTPVAASVVAAAIVGVATLGGTFAGNEPVAAKADRFAVIGDELCANQVWPNLTPECLSWKEGESGQDHVRFVTFSQTDRDAGVTTLVRTPEIMTN